MTWYAGLHSTDAGGNTGWEFGSFTRAWYAGTNSVDAGGNAGWIFQSNAPGTDALYLRSDMYDGYALPLTDSIVIGPGGDPIDIQARLDANDGTWLTESNVGFRAALLSVVDATGSPILHT